MLKGFKIPSFSVLLIFAVLSVVGAALAPSLNLQYLPQQKQQSLTINYSWPGASARVIESEVTSRIEGYISSIQGISTITSFSNKDYGYVTVGIKKKADIDAVRFEIASALRSLHDKLPQEVSYPEISVASGGANIDPIMTYTVNADLPTNSIEQYVNKHILKELSVIEGVSAVRLSGATPYYTEISFNAEKVKATGLSSSALHSAVSSFLAGRQVVGSSSLDGSGSRPDIVLTHRRIDLKDMPIANSDGRIIHLRDVARTETREKVPDSYYRINGLNTINITIYPEKSVNTIKVCAEIDRVMGILKEGFPESFSALKAYDVSTEIQKEVDTLVRRTLLCIVILLAFVFVTSLSLRYTVLIAVTMLVNIVVAFIFYVLLDIDIHIYSLAGISISLSIIIDNSIIMVSHYSYYRDRKVFTAILAALLTTIGSLVVVFFLPEQQKQVLGDFSWVTIINLTVSMFIALLFVPALLDHFPIRSESISFSMKRRRRIVRFSRRYSRFIGVTKRFSWAVVLLFALAFGGSLMLFRKSLDGFSSMFRQPERPTLHISAGMSEGCSVQQLNEIVIYMENFLAEFDGIRLFRTSVTSPRSASITVEFTEEAISSPFPAMLKQQVIRKAIDYGGANWSVYGVDDQNFNNNVGFGGYRSSRITMTGYNYDMLYDYCRGLQERLASNPRVKDLIIEGHGNTYRSTGNTGEFVIAYNYDSMLLYGISPVAAYSAMREKLYSSPVGHITDGNGVMEVRMVSDDAEDFDVWRMQNEYIRIDSTDIRFSQIGNIERHNSSNTIYRADQQYLLYVSYNFIGSNKLSERLKKAEIERLNSQVLPMGFKASSPTYDWFMTYKNQWVLLLLIMAIIYLICAVLFESLLQPLAIISLIPASFIGIFLIFRLTETTFDQGGFASMIMLAGIVVNAGIYIVSEYNRMPAHRRTFVRAYNHKIIPITLTILSTVLGLLPFLFDGKQEVFWFAFAIGTIGGMLFSFLALIVLLPMIMKR